MKSKPKFKPVDRIMWAITGWKGSITISSSGRVDLYPFDNYGRALYDKRDLEDVRRVRVRITAAKGARRK